MSDAQMTRDPLNVRRATIRELADALDTAYGCLDLVRSGRRPVDLLECIAEVRAAREKALDLMEQP